MELSLDLIILILKHLPAKSLLRFKSVSKEWYSLITSPYFTKLHHHTNHPNYPQFIILTNHNEGPFCLERKVLDANLTLTTTKIFLPDWSKREAYSYVYIVGSCHGLVMLKLDYANNGFSTDLIMWNPSTNNYVVLPPVDFPDYPHLSRKRKLFPNYGFGYDRSTDDYKLVVFVQVTYNGYNIETYCQRVYSAKRNSWGPPLLVECRYMETLGPAVVDDRIFHWIESFRSGLFDKDVIWGFDICTEEWIKTELHLPDFGANAKLGEKYMHVSGVGVLVNCLCLVSGDYLVNNTDVWLMKEYGVKESWTKIASLHDCNKMWGLCPIAYCDGHLLFLYGKSYILYDLKDKSMKSVGVHYFEYPTLCAESLVPIPVPTVTTKTE